MYTLDAKQHTTLATAITPAKANRLYWLGRYAERVGLSLHLLRRYFDKMTDGSGDEYQDYYNKLDTTVKYGTEKDFRLGYLYDLQNPCSLVSGLTKANDNAIVLREELKSETLAYIQMSMCSITTAGVAKDSNITDLQCITDYLLAFWGSADERITDERVRALLLAGKFVEYVDMHARFEYPVYRLKEAYAQLRQIADRFGRLMDKEALKGLDTILKNPLTDPLTGKQKAEVLSHVNKLVKI